MTADGSRPVFHLPARDIPIPSSISPEAHAMLAMGPLMPDTEYPPLDDHDAWRAMIAEQESAVLAMLTAAGRTAADGEPLATHRALRAAGVPAELHVQEAAGHGGFLGQAPEDRERFQEIRRFLGEHWAAHAAQ